MNDYLNSELPKKKEQEEVKISRNKDDEGNMAEELAKLLKKVQNEENVERNPPETPVDNDTKIKTYNTTCEEQFETVMRRMAIRSGSVNDKRQEGLSTGLELKKPLRNLHSSQDFAKLNDKHTSDQCFKVTGPLQPDYVQDEPWNPEMA